MKTQKWTSGQIDAINSTKGTILVSAAAGSGKTAVLVERVMKLLTDEESPCDATNLLIVTFTKAAAAEMKERISAKIAELLAENPYDLNLQRKQILISQAHISTIHSFCSELIRENFYKLNISSKFRVADENEMVLLRDEAVNLVLEEVYKKSQSEFKELSESFITDKNENKLIKIINEVYNFTRSYPFPEEWVKEKMNMYENYISLEKTPWMNLLFNYLNDDLNHCLYLTKISLELMNKDEKILKAYAESFKNDLYSLEDIKNSLNNPQWDTIHRKLKNFDFKRLKTLKSCESEDIKEAVSENRKEVKSIIKNLQGIFDCTDEDCLSDISKTSTIINELFILVNNFSNVLDEMKKERNVLDFGDLEHLTLKLLIDKNEKGYEKSEIAKELSQSFSQIMVDEYQDTNEAQDMIFKLISKDEKNLFMVGDVKQSIYGFRQAMPEIFINKKNKYEVYRKELNKYPSKIILDRNFRSRSGIINIVNFIFNLIMSEQVGEIVYNDEERLVAAANYDKKKEADVFLKVIDIEEEQKEDPIIIEARYIAKLILEKIGSREKVKDGDQLREVTFGDFCILLRSPNKIAEKFMKEMQLMGVPTFAEKEEGFFYSKEIATILSLLRVIDNPIQDVPLVSVLMSNIYGFTSDEVAEIRMCNKEVGLYFALIDCSKNGNVKCKDFLNDLDKFRKVGATMPSDKFINYIYNQTAYVATVLAMKNGRDRLLNLRLLQEYARNYEASGYKGLTGFIRFIDKLSEKKSDLPGAVSASQNSNSVKIMSVHKSKGLEFPICILANCSKQFNKEDNKRDTLISPNLGIGMKLKNNEKFYKYTTFIREAVLLDKKSKDRSEEMRILYVAMTRAKEQLIIISSQKDVRKNLLKLSFKISKDKKITPYVVKKANSFSDWILMCAMFHPGGKVLRRLAGLPEDLVLTCTSQWDIEIVKSGDEFLTEEDEKISVPSLEIDTDLIKKINDRLSYSYRYNDILSLPTKVTVSDLVSENVVQSSDFDSKPEFLSNKQENKSVMTGAQRGTALHNFLQYIDFSVNPSELEKHIKGLVDKGFLTKEQSKVLNLKKIKNFLNSSLARRIANSSNVQREYKFTININASRVKKDLPENLSGEKIILQGAIDCLFEENNEFVLVDYKTDIFDNIDDFREKYKNQVYLYKEALEKCTGKKVKEILLYSFHKNQIILL